MATPISTLRPALNRQVNTTGIARLPDVTPGELDGHLADAFWSLRLKRLLPGWTLTDYDELDDPPVGGSGFYFTKTANQTDPFPETLGRAVVIMATFNLIRLAILNLAINFKAKAGPTEYEQQASATTLRAILDSLSRELEGIVEDEMYQGLFIYLDGELQSYYSELHGLRYLAVIP